MKNTKPIIYLLVAIAIIVPIVYLESLKADRGGEGEVVDISVPITEEGAVANEEKESGVENTLSDRSGVLSEKRTKYPTAKELVAPAGFVNTEPFNLADHIGEKVILLDIWTYSCINCQRTLPYITAWNDTYEDQGLLIVGVHTPEFEFEKDVENVIQATEKFGVEYPVVLDNDYGTWNAYGNRYWPRKYLIDIDGFVVYDHIGEGAYEETERVIQELLRERSEVLGLNVDVEKDMTTPEGVELVDYTRPRSPEIYFGALRNDALGNGFVRQEGVQNFVRPITMNKNTLYLEGDWNITREFAENTSAGAKIIFKYQAAKVFMVASSEEGVHARIFVDGEPAGARAGSSVEQDGTILIQNEQLYRLVEDPDGWGEHTLEIEVLDPGLEAFTFTFG